MSAVSKGNGRGGGRTGDGRGGGSTGDGRGGGRTGDGRGGGRTGGTKALLQDSPNHSGRRTGGSSKRQDSGGNGSFFDASLSLSEEDCTSWERVEGYIETFSSQLLAEGSGPTPRPGQPLCPKLEHATSYGRCPRGNKCPLNHPFYRYEVLLPDEAATTSVLRLKFILEKLLYLSRCMPHMPHSSRFFTGLCSCLEGIYTQLFLLVPRNEEEMSPEDVFRLREQYYLEKCICFFAIPHTRLLFLDYCSLACGSQNLALKHDHAMRVQKGLMRFCCFVRLKEDSIVANIRENYNNCDALLSFGNAIDLHCKATTESSATAEDARIKIQLQLHDIATRLWESEGHIRVHLDPFGSSQNTLGSTSSDIDFCLHFAGLTSPSKSDNTSHDPKFPLAKFNIDADTSTITPDVNIENNNEDETSLILSDDDDDADDDDANDIAPNDNSVPTDIFNDFSKAGAITILSMLEVSIRSDVQLSQQFEITEMVDSARVPVLKILHVESNINVDICYRNLMALQNTHLLRTYSSFDPRVRPLLLLVKQWTSRRKINDSRNSLPSSYAWNLLVIYFLQVHNVIPYIFLNDDRGKLTHWDKGNHGLRDLSSMSLGELTVEFFIFFGTAGQHLFDDFCEIIRVVRAKPHHFKSCGSRISGNIAFLNNVVEKQVPSSLEEQELFSNYRKHLKANLEDVKPLNRIGKNGSSRVAAEAGVPFRICIEDPLEDHDLGRVVHNQMASALIATEFRRAISIIMRLFKNDRGGDMLHELLSTADCQIVALPFLCKICGGTHNTRDCVMMCCERCLSTKHMRKNCDVCIICLQVGHFAKSCPKKRGRNGNRNSGRRSKR